MGKANATARLSSVILAAVLAILLGSSFYVRNTFARDARTEPAKTVKRHWTSPPVDPTGCKECHRAEVEGFGHSAMGDSLHVAGREPIGSVEARNARITVQSSAAGTWQVLGSDGIRTKFHVGYVIGSGTHARGYLVDIGNHLFQSPIAYYTQRHGYGLAPGYETDSDPDFTRSITQGAFSAIPEKQNLYRERETSIGPR